MDGHPQTLDAAAQDGPAGLIDLQGHQPRREFDDVHAQSQVAERVSSLQAQQAPANDHPGARAIARPACDRFQVLDGAVDEAAGGVGSGNRGNKRIRTRGQNQAVVGDGAPGCCGNRLGWAIDGHDPLVEKNAKSGVVVLPGAAQGQLLGAAPFEEGR